MFAVRGAIELLKALQHLLNTGWCHLPPRAVGISRLFSSRAMAFDETRPFAWNSRIVEASALARASAARLLSWPLLILPPLPDMSSPSRVSILNTVVYCHLPPRAVGILRRFNSSAIAWRDTKPAARSLRRVEARARASAARLMTSGPPRIRRVRDEVSAWLLHSNTMAGR